MNNPLEPSPSWWKRNWKWLVPVSGCLTLIIILIIAVGSLFFGVTKILTDSQPYEYAFELINKDEYTLELLGSPIEKDGMVQGDFKWSNGNKRAKMTIPIAGPKGKGTLFIDAVAEGDTWNYREIKVEVSEENVDLLDKVSEE